jgi:hypothetical protein
MRYLKHLIVAFFIVLVAISTSAQIVTTDPQSIIADILEDISSASEEEVDLDGLAEDLIFLTENPINLNATSQTELSKLIFLSDFQIASLLDYVKTQGEMLSIYEIQMVYGFDFKDVQRLLPFVTIGPSDKKTAPRLRYGRNDMFIRTKSLIETQKGYTPAPENDPLATRYKGDKMSLYTRYTFRTQRNFQAGFVAEKDAGEEFFRGSNPYGFDHYSFHAQLSDIGNLKTLVVGDFNAEFGQGLTLWTSASFGKSPDVMGYRKRGRGLIRSSSTNENQFLRGAGATVKYRNFYISAFGSYKKIDANISDSLIDGEVMFSSMPNSGLHRTPSEIKNKKTLGEMVVGGNVNTSWKNVRLGTTASLVNLQGVFEGSSQLYRQYEPPLNNRLNIGTDISFAIGNHLLYGEAATTIGHGAGIIAGGLFRLHPLLNVSILGRTYAKDYSPYYTSALSEGTGSANEDGMLFAFTLKPIKHWEISGYADYFSSSWLRYNVSAPSRGHEYLIQASYSPRSTTNFNLRYRYKQKEKNVTIDTTQVRWLLPYSNQSLRFHCAFSPSRIIELKSRIEFSWYNIEGSVTERGMLMYQDVSYRPQSIPLVLTARFAIFDTDGYNARIYAYENDVLYSFSIPAYYSQGTRFYIIGKYSIGKKVDLWLRYAQTYFTNTTSIGSGLDLINGPTRSDIRAQIRLRF